MRGFGLDVHRDFCEVAIAEDGEVRSAGRIATRVEALELFAASLVSGDVVVLEATTGSDKIVSVLEQHGVRVVVANTRKLKAISEAKAKTDRLDARTLCAISASPDAPLALALSRKHFPRATVPADRHAQSAPNGRFRVTRPSSQVFAARS